MSKKYVDKNSGIITCQLPQACDAKYLVVVADRGMTSEINHFGTLKEAKRTFREIANDYGYRPSEMNGSDKYDVSIWKWTEERYQRVHYYD